MYYKQAQVAANWWIEGMKKRCSKLYPHKVIVEDSNFVIIDNSFAEELSRFETLLITEIQDCLEKGSFLLLSCYLLPNRDLANMAKKAKISTTYFPTNVAMDIAYRKISVSVNSDKLRNLPLPAE